MATPPLIFVLNGPNLNLLGSREPEIYGTETLDDIAAGLSRAGGRAGLALDIRQSNHEGHLIDWLHEAQAQGAKAVILNPGGYSHTSVALHDAVKAIATPVIEVHLSNPKPAKPFATPILSPLPHPGDQGRRRARIFTGTGRGRPALTGSAAAKQTRVIENGRSEGTAAGPVRKRCASTARWCASWPSCCPPMS